MPPVTCTVNTVATSSTSGTSSSQFLSGWNAAGNLAVLAIMHSQAAASVPDLASITGGPINGALTKKAVTALNMNATPKQKVEIWYGITASGTGTFNFSFAQNISAFRCQYVEFANVDQTKGTLGIIQAATQFSDTANTAGACTMAPLANAGSAVFAIFGSNNNGTMAPKAGFTEVFESQLQTNQPFQDFEGQFRASTTDNNPQATHSGAVQWGAIALEIAGVGGPVSLVGKASTASSAKQGVVQRFR